MKIDLVKQLINEFENSEVFKMKVEIDAVSYTHLDVYKRQRHTNA